MANRVQDFGMDVAINRRLNAKYDAAAEHEVLQWIQSVTGVQIEAGRENVHAKLRDGVVLVNLIRSIYAGTDAHNLTPQGQAVKQRSIKAHTSNTAFKMMENIDIFLQCSHAYGVSQESLFDSASLYECRNMAAVLSTLLQLGTECQRNNFNGARCGPPPTEKNARNFSQEQLRKGNNVIGLQAGTNKLASQKGMNMGGQRHIADIRCDDMTREGQSVIGLQMGTNKLASQKGMSMGGQRHISDIKCADMTAEGSAIIGLQMGTNKCASQKGMSHGGQRHVSDIKCDSMTAAGSSVIGLQMGTNQLASQKGMSFGGVRHGADIRCDNFSKSGEATIGLQMGSNKVASQAGMSFGNVRHGADIRCDNMSSIGSSTIGLQMGYNQGATQAGMNMGAQRHIGDVHENHVPHQVYQQPEPISNVAQFQPVQQFPQQFMTPQPQQVHYQHVQPNQPF